MWPRPLIKLAVFSRSHSGSTTSAAENTGMLLRLKSLTSACESSPHARNLGKPFIAFKPDRAEFQTSLGCFGAHCDLQSQPPLCGEPLCERGGGTRLILQALIQNKDSGSLSCFTTEMARQQQILSQGYSTCIHA